MSQDASRTFDCIGVGIGPSNLSLACLLDPVREISLRLLDQRSGFVWHEGVLLADATIQVAFMKDLVTLVDPTNRFSFLAFLRDQKRLYQFLNARFCAAKRTEFNQYFQWVCRNLGDTLEFSQKVRSVDFVDEFVVETDRGAYRARNLVAGTGRAAAVPPCAEGKLCGTLLHSSDFLLTPASFAGKRVVVLGGGQSGAEIFLDLVSRLGGAAPARCTWISRRNNFLPIDDSSFTNEFFTPGYADHFYSLSPAVRRQQLDEQKLASDGISLDTITRIYQAVYESRYLQRGATEVSLRPGAQLVDIRRCGAKWQLVVLPTCTDVHEILDAEIVILATGFRYVLPAWLEPIAHRLEMAGQEIALNGDFSAKWDGPRHNRLFMQNAGRAQWGIADANLSLISWRSARIINSLVGRRVYDLDESAPIIDWMPAADAPFARQVSV
jgi:lysine N6-hydroxylase